MDILIYLALIGFGAMAGGGGADYADSYTYPAPDSDVALLPTPEPAPPSSFPSETQTPTGDMTTATEVRPILTATRDSWVAVRTFDGQDLLYFTNLLAWRCGLSQITYRINGAPPAELVMEPCHTDEPAPNAMKMDVLKPYIELPPGTVETVHVDLLYDDLSVDSADYDRKSIEIE